MNIPDRDSAPEFPGFPDTRPGSAVDLLSDCRHIAGHWTAASPSAGTASPVTPSSIRGTTVPAASALAVAGMSEYGS